MPKLSFGYCRFGKVSSDDPLGRRFILRPIIPVRLFAAPDRHINTFALLDTGSDDTIFDSELAESVGIDWKSGRSYSIMGIDGGKIEVRFKEATYAIGGHWLHAPIGVAKLPSMFKAILGQTGFFDQVCVSFRQSDNQIDIDFAVRH